MKKPEKLKMYRVDIQFTTEFSYNVEALSAEGASEEARRQYESGEDTHIHSEVFDAQVTNVETING